MKRFLSTRLIVLALSALASALVLAEGSVPVQTGEDAPFNFATFRNIARQQGPCVVAVVADWAGDGSLQDDEPSEDELPGKGIGSGVILTSDGLILTNHHVVAGSEAVQVTLQDGSTLTAEVVGRDPELDVALLRVTPPRPLQPAVFGDSRRLEVGDWVMAIGSPYGLSNSVSVGIVSALGRNLQSGNYDDFIQTDAAINVGNSGGPLFNIRGEVIGITSAILTSGGASSGIGFAIPAHDLLPVVEQLRRSGHATRGWLGIALDDPTPSRRVELGLVAKVGPVVSDVWPDSPASRAGLRPGDIVLSFGPRRIESLRSLLFAVAFAPVGFRLPLAVQRGPARLTLQVVVGSRPEQTEVAPGPVAEVGADADLPARSVETTSVDGTKPARMVMLR